MEGDPAGSIRVAGVSQPPSHIPPLCAKDCGGSSTPSGPRSRQTNCTCDFVSGRLTLSSAFLRQPPISSSLQQRLQEDELNCCSGQDYIRREERPRVRHLRARSDRHVAETHCEFPGCVDPQLKGNYHPTFSPKHMSGWSVSTTGRRQLFHMVVCAILSDVKKANFDHPAEFSKVGILNCTAKKRLRATTHPLASCRTHVWRCLPQSRWERKGTLLSSRSLR